MCSEAIKPMDIKGIDKVGQGHTHVCLREENISFDNNLIIGN
jgi:hypothetical protein